MEMKIAIIIERENTALGGAERSIFELAAALSGFGIKVHILAAKGQTEAKNIHILCQDKPGRRTSYKVFEDALKKHLSENQYHLIHSVLPFDFTDVYQPRGGAYAESILRNAASYQNKLFEYYKKLTAFVNYRRSILLRAERKLASDSNGPVIAALSGYVAEQFKQHYNTNAERIVVIHNGVKTDKHIDKQETDRLRTQILTKLNLKETDNPVLFLFAANNFRLKGLSVLIEAMAAAENYETERQSYLIVAGKDHAYKYLRIARRHNIHKKIFFLGQVKHIENALSVTDVAVLPTFYDPSSRFILEATAAHNPVITTRFNGATDLLTDNRHGKIIDKPEDVSGLTEAIVYFTNTDNINKASQAIIEDNLEEKISIRRVAEQLVALYETILRKKG
ncbi:MAG: glycosyltransferase family 4 protein [Sedimentisphaerales bacterium]|nr:glycosyltransferase family 4 protein [Sedimentisphaerales bacterium]